MKFRDYLKDKAFMLIISFITLLLLILLFVLAKINTTLVLCILFILILAFVLILLKDYSKKKKFYDHFNQVLEDLDQKYLIHEIIKDGNFLESNYLLNYLNDIDKSYLDNLSKYKYSLEEFKEYLELWCHEIKTPIATSSLILNNQKTKLNANILEEINKIEGFVEQVLYYARSENVNKDYLITKTNLKEVINNVIKKNKKILLEKKIKLIPLEKDVLVESDSKWLEFIIDQIVSNSIKYSKDKPYIKFEIKENVNNTLLFITDNGIGISVSDLPKIFDKGFTGSNGRKKYNSTGIGLYLAKKLSLKLGHELEITSILDKETKATIIFPKGNLTKM